MISSEQRITDAVPDLAAGESVIWSGRPNPFVSMWSKGWMAALAIVWLAATGNGIAAAAGRAETFGALVGVAFLGMGIWMLAGPFLEFLRAKRTTYVITENRLIIADLRRRHDKSIELSAIKQVERLTKWGRVTLRIPTALVDDGDGGQKVEYTDLHGLEDGDRAYRLLTRRAT
jgi:hypothetical protein